MAILNNISLRNRIFLSMIVLVLLTSILIVTVTIIQYDEQTKDYNVQRFGRKEDATKQDIEIKLQQTTFPITTENIANIFESNIYEMARVHKLTISMYDMYGCLLKSSVPVAFEKIEENSLSPDILYDLGKSSEYRITRDKEEKGTTYQSSYTYINDTRFKRIGILELQIAQDNELQKKELREFISRLSLVYILMFLIAILLAYLLSSYITKSIQEISQKIKETRLNKRNEKIVLASASSEINSLIESYNNMIDQLEDSAAKLAQSEREQAWKEMAKNPLTPMRLTVQSFERRFDPEDLNIKEKVKEYSQTLIQQIDVMSSIASAFSDFAKMPSQRKENLDVVDVVKHALDIFQEDFVNYQPHEKEIYAHLDKTQLVRIVTNLVKNATQAIDTNHENPQIKVEVLSEVNNVKIIITDNGKGISEANKKLIFEPKFTTKTSGMGLGLPMIKNIIEAYNGSISFTSKEGVGTQFIVILPKN